MVEFFLLYFYDLKPIEPSRLSSLKRKFYYHLNKLMEKSPSRFSWKTKSVLVVDPSMEPLVDNFFKQFKPQISVFKVRTKIIEDLE